MSDTTSIRSSVTASDVDGLSVRHDDYETPASSFTEQSHANHSGLRMDSFTLIAKKRERFQDKNPWRRRRLGDDYTL
jgi:hypothetical protein